MVEHDFIFLFDFVPRMRESLRKVAIVRQNEQAFALRVEAADVEKPRQFCRQQIENGVARVRILTSGDEAFRFVQKNIKRTSRWPNEFAVYFDVVAFRRLRAKIQARLPVYRDATGCDQFIAMPSRSDAGGGKKAI